MLLGRARREGIHVDEAEAKFGLPCEMKAQIRLGHWRDRMMTHGWMAVDADHHAVGLRKQIAEDDGAAQARRSDDDGHCAGAKHGAAEFHGAADVANLRRTVKGRADFVVIHRSAEPADGLKYRGQIRDHPPRAAASAFAGDSDGAAIGESRQGASVGSAREQDGLHAVQRKCLEHVGRAGKVVAIPGVEQAG